MDPFWGEYEAGEIHGRDIWQFELKSQFMPLASQKQSEYTQEFFIFIPDSLQINPYTYKKEDFFLAQTNLIRLQTPDLSFDELLDRFREGTPFFKLWKLQSKMSSEEDVRAVESELKLFATIFRKTLRQAIYPIVQALQGSIKGADIKGLAERIQELLNNTKLVETEFSRFKETSLEKPQGYVLHHIFNYIQDAISISLNSSLSALLEAVRLKADPNLHQADDAITKILLRERKYREEQMQEPDQLENNAIKNETILHQSGLLNKFILNALQLKVERHATDEKYRSLIGSFAAGIAGLLYLLLFIWQGAVFVINSLPFVLFSVIIYIIKDRIKDELKNFSFQNIFKWFHDYTTKISLPDSKNGIGKMQESFSFVNESDVPLDIWDLRSKNFHSYLEMIKRPEQVINYKRKVTIYGDARRQGHPLEGLNVIFRYDIHHFLAKASNAYEPYTTIDTETFELIHIWLPKVYHINVVLKNVFLQADLTTKIEYKTYRIVADKEGIKRIESL